MKLWRFALIAAVAGFIHGVTSSEPPFSHLQKAAVSITRLPVSWWADRMANRADLAFTKLTNVAVPDHESNGTTSTTFAVHSGSETTRSRVLDDGIDKPTDWNSDSEPQGGMADVLLTDKGLSVDAKNLSLSSLLEDLSEKCDIEILGKDALSDKVISAKFDSMKVENGIRQLMRIAGVENYALSYRTDHGGQYPVSQLVFFLGDNEFSEDYPIAKPGPQVDLTMPEHHLQGQFLGDYLTAEVPEQILADVQAEIRAKVPEEMRADILAEILGGLRE